MVVGPWQRAAAASLSGAGTLHDSLAAPRVSDDPKHQARLYCEIVAQLVIADGQVTILTRFKTLPLSQGKVANELRRRLLAAFIANGIRPYASY